MKKPIPEAEIIAHRGASADAPENTLESFELAIKQGADWIEFDVRRSADGVLFIHHDPNRGTTLLRRQTFVAIKALPGAGAIPTLEEVLQLAKGRIKVDIELKESGFESQVVELINRYFEPENVLITSFIDDVLAHVKQLNPKIRTGLLVGQSLTDQDPLRQLGDFFPHRRLRKINADVVVCQYLVGDIVGRWWLRRLGIPVIVWTVDQPKRIRRYLMDPNVIAIITNRPAVALELRDEAEIAKLKPKKRS